MFELNGYRMVEKIGENEEISLYRLVRLKDNINVIAKTASSNDSGSNMTNALQNEFEQLAALDGRGALKPYSFEIIANQPFLLFDDSGGKTLEQLLQSDRDAMKLDGLLRVAISIVECLHTIHQAQIVVNQMTLLSFYIDSESNVAKFIDIRSSSRKDTQQQVPITNNSALPYMSLELTGRTGIVPDYRTDIYSIGVILYEWFSKSLPFQSDSALDLVYHHLAKTPDPVYRKNPTIPRIVSDIIMKCMEKMPDARYGSAYGIKADLEECLLQFRVMGKVHPFPLANRGVSEKPALERMMKLIEEKYSQEEQFFLYDHESLKKLLHQALQGQIDDINDLVTILLDKTRGNPHLLMQFLKSISDQQLLVFDLENNKWQCEIQQVARLNVPEGEADTLVNSLNNLSEQLKQLLSQASFLGKQFDLMMLSIITQLKIEQLVGWAEKAVSYRILQRIHHEPFTYIFQHDSIYQSVYERISEQERKSWHMKIGFLLAEKMRMGEAGIDIFTVVHHLNQAAEEVILENKKRQLIALNVEAGLLAKEENTLAESLPFLRFATDLITEEDWEQDYPLVYKVFKANAEVEFLCSHFANADRLFKILLEKAATNLDKAKLNILMIQLEISRDQYQDAIAIGKRTLELLGINHRLTSNAMELSLKIQKVRWKLRSHSVQSLSTLPPMQEERLKVAMSVLAHMCNASFVLNKEGWLFTILKMVELTLDHGITEEAAVAFSGYALILNDQYRKHNAVHEWGTLACTLAQKDQALAAQASTSFLLCHVTRRRYDMENILTLANHAIQTARESDNIWQTNHTVFLHMQLLFQLGHPLEDLYTRLLFHSSNFEKSAYSFHWRGAAVLARFISELTGYRSANDPFVEVNIQSKTFIDDAPGDVKIILQEMVYISQYVIGYLLGDFQKAYDALERCLAVVPSRFNSFFKPSHHFYQVLILKELYSRAKNNREKSVYYSKMRSSLKKLKSMANRYPQNYLHKYFLAKIEVKLLKENNFQASRLFEQALDIARTYGHRHDTAIIAECFAKYGLQRGKLQLAKLYMNEAYETYLAWGAVIKTDELAAKYNYLLQIKKENDLEQVDYLSVVKSAQALSSEMDMNRLLNMLMRIMLQNAGAEYGALIFKQEDEWFVEAYGTLDQISVQSIPLEKAEDLVPKAIIEYTAKTKEEIVLNDVAYDGMFTRATEEYTRLKSVLCLPIEYQKKLIGLLYMVNNLSTGIFTKERLDILKLLSSQCAIAITNAKLFTGIQDLKEHLEEQVIERTESLEKSMKATSEALAEMTVYAERNRIAQEIHDIVGHTLTSTVLQIEAGKRLLHHDIDSAADRLQEAQSLVRHSLSEIRNSVHMLKEDKYYDIMNAIQQLIGNTERNTTAKIHAVIDPITHVSLLHKKVIYHALQEGLTNGIRHGNSTEFTFYLRDNGTDIEFQLADNGIGASNLKMGFGLTMMNERVLQLKGNLTISAKPNQGCVLRIHIPY